MSGPNNDELAKLLSAMANGQIADDSAAESADNPTGSTPPASRPPRVAVALSAPASAHTTPPVVAQPIQRPWGPSLFLKRTLIPILLTLGVLCPAFGVLGYCVSSTSPYAVFAEPWFFIPFVTIGVVMLGLAIVMMMLVRDELSRQR